MPSLGVPIITSPDPDDALIPEDSKIEPPWSLTPSPAFTKIFPPDTVPAPDDNEMSPPVPALISSAPPSLPFASPTVSIIDPDLPKDDNPVLMAIDPLVPTVLDPVPRDIEPLTPPGPLSTATDPE
jgi:hypothetical protein